MPRSGAVQPAVRRLRQKPSHGFAGRRCSAWRREARRTSDVLAHIIYVILALAPGARLGAYEVIAQIGAGGMGQVYRARDTKLERDVALKVLPEAFTNDSDRLARFRREAQVLASLNHPNIAAIYGF